MTIEAALRQLEELTAAGTLGCGFCPAPVAGDLTGWTARVLDEDLTWRPQTPDGASAVLPAATYMLCPPCETAVATGRPRPRVDALLDLAELGGWERDVARSEVAAVFLRASSRMGPPMDLAVALTGAGDG